MIGRRAWLRRTGLFAALGLLLGGCAPLVDAINPDLFTALGIVPDALVEEQGVILIVFNNTTQSDATFYGFSAKNASDLSRDSRNFSVFVGAGENRNEVIKCPVDVLGAGQIDGTGLSAIVANVNGTDISYANGALLTGSGVLCGDVIEVRLVQTGTGTGEGAFAVVIQIHPGQ